MGSYIELDAGIVARACARYMEARNAEIEKRRNALIDREMKRRFFASKTREEAIKRLKEGDSFSEYSHLQWLWGDQRMRVEALGLLAIAGSKTVNVGEDVIDAIYEYLEA